MKIFMTNGEIKSSTKIVEQIVVGCNNVATVLNDTLAKVDVNGMLSDEAIAEANSAMKGMAHITKEADGYTLEISEEFVIDSCDICRDFIIDFYDVLRYAIKTAKAFVLLTFKPFQEKWTALISKNINK